MSFNWLYVDDAHLAFFHSGWYPVRARGVDPDLPTWGTGDWEWRGRLDWRLQPQEIDPATGWAVSWSKQGGAGMARARQRLGCRHHPPGGHAGLADHGPGRREARGRSPRPTW